MNSKPPVLQETPDFSLVLGGPLYQLYLRACILQPELGLLGRRVVVITLFAWLPLLLLSALGGSLLGGDVKVDFLHDIEAHVRFLIALPVLIAAEMIVHQRVRLVVRQFVDGGIVVPDEMPKFHAAIDSAVRLRNSVALEVALLVLVYTFGHWAWQDRIALDTATWYGDPGLTLAGYWYAYVSIPIFQFILLRWYLRLLIWFWFLWRVSRLNLRITATHPDRAGGLGFLGDSAYAFAPLLFAQGALLAGLIASRIFYGGQTLLDFKMEAGVLIVFFIVFILGPLCMFTSHLARAKRQGEREYGAFAARYVQGFEEKWIRGGADEQLLGTGDIQSLADLGNSYEVVRKMRVVPFGLDAVTRLAAATAAPLLPLALTMMPLADLVGHLLKIVF
jgi:hypothetical protein